MATIRQIRFCGLGGHGVVFAGTILGKAAIMEGKWVSGANAYGSQARGGLAKADVVISDQPIKYPHLLETDILLAFSQSAYMDQVSNVKPDSGAILFDQSQFQPEARGAIKQIGLAVTNTVLKELENKQVVNIAFLAAMNAIFDIVDYQSLEQTIQAEVPPQFLELNQKALVLGRKLGEAAR